MLKKALANTAAKKTSIFFAAFAITLIGMCSRQTALQNEFELVKEAMVSFSEGPAVSVMNTLQKVLPAAMPSSAIQLLAEEKVAGVPTFPFTEYPKATEEVLPARPAVKMNIPIPNGFTYSDRIPLSYDLQLYTYHRCIETNLDYELVLALMWRESRFQVDAVGHNSNGTQDSGIMQINDVNRGWLASQHGITDLMDPVQNINAGTLMLSQFTNKYGMHDGLMAYQYGEYGMKKKFEQGVMTNDSIAALLQKRADFRAILENV